jgi:hypothetical protein
VGEADLSGIAVELPCDGSLPGAVTLLTRRCDAPPAALMSQWLRLLAPQDPGHRDRHPRSAPARASWSGPASRHVLAGWPGRPAGATRITVVIYGHRGSAPVTGAADGSDPMANQARPTGFDVVTGAFSYSGAARLDFGDPAGLAESLRGAQTLYNTYWVRFPRGPVNHAAAVANSRVLFRAAGTQGFSGSSTSRSRIRASRPIIPISGQGRGRTGLGRVRRLLCRSAARGLVRRRRCSYQ